MCSTAWNTLYNKDIDKRIEQYYIHSTHHQHSLVGMAVCKTSTRISKSFMLVGNCLKESILHLYIDIT